MEEKYKKFLEFSWKDSPEWQIYYSNLSEVPHPSKIEHFKKRFYKFKIDADFDVKYTPTSQSESSNNSNSRSNQYQYSNPNPNSQYNNYATTGQSINSPLLATIEAATWVGFLLSILMPYYTLKIAALALLLRVIRRTGKPKFTIDYAQLIFLDEHFQLLLFSILFMIDRFNLFTLVPLGITAVLNICEYARNNQNKFTQFMPYINKIINKRVELALMRANVEVAIGFLLVLGIFLNLNSFILPIFFWQYLRFKYIVNNDIKLSFAGLNGYMNRFKNRNSTPGAVKFIVEKIQQFAEYMGRTEAQPGQAAGGANCTIF